MKVFLLDLWHDLREKRLWPVAVALAVALVALPVALLRPAGEEESAPAPAPGAAATPAERAIVALAQDAGVDPSALEAFAPRDPFAGPRRKAPGEGEQPPTPDAGGGDQGAPAGGEQPGGAPAGGGEQPGGTPPAPGGTGGDGGSGGDGGGERRRATYVYTVDARFGRADSPRTYRSLQRLDVLPQSGDPLVVFLGVSPTGKSAIFLVDSDLEQHGDGRCQPSRAECSFLHLTLDPGHDLHFFVTPSGDRYALRLLDIQRERTDVLARRARAARAAKRRRARTAHGRRRDGEARPSFRPPLFAGDEQDG